MPSPPPFHHLPLTSTCSHLLCLPYISLPPFQYIHLLISLISSTSSPPHQVEFSKFGKIMDVRINTAKGKTGPKGQVPNFGFITFEEESTVTRVLNSRVSASARVLRCHCA